MTLANVRGSDDSCNAGANGTTIAIMTVGTTDLSSAYALWEPAGAIVPDKPGGLFLRLSDRLTQLGRDLSQD